ncbi:putative FAD-linked oxidoreductase [Pseudoruegeria aquimaris]|uniref:Putative FAD-linked oxidoreductase n=1 Tax=Pseudoruegeria aquimaris TaxID=393663 RepID=A0A1Y5THC3_9RHOB|nr:FAD-binding protein [Pseudoruegeria aquimaris]SLN60386.1 putative FAD-linked oxidoreductase [Pseudoruegeria aquimaris]
MTPKTEAELSEAIAAAQGPLAIRGGGTRAFAQAEGETLSTAGLAGITLHEPGALTLVAAAGTPLADIEAALEAEGQRLAFEPPDLRGLLGREGVSTIGGVVAANASGPRRIQAGACRDFLLGVRFVDGSGTIVKNGGRVMKNVTGYDLVKLMAGSHGTLGVLSEVSLKVLPKPEATAVLLIEGLGDDQAVAAMSAALGSPYDVTGAAHTQKGVDGAPVTMIRVEGFTPSVAYRAQALKEKLARFGDIAIEDDPEKTAAGWAWVRDVSQHVGQPGDVWRISVKPSDGPEVARRLPGAEVLYDWGGGLLWARVPEGSDVRGLLGDLPGHATRVRGGDAGIATFHPEPAPVAALSQGLRARFDPRGILNPGIMG